MTIQPPSFTFGRKREFQAEDSARASEATRTDQEKYGSPVVDRTSSVSSYASDEKQTFGVAKVEAVTSVWTKKALIVLYVLYAL
jgi:hypothetical protein